MEVREGKREMCMNRRDESGVEFNDVLYYMQCA